MYFIPFQKSCTSWNQSIMLLIKSTMYKALNTINLRRHAVRQGDLVTYVFFKLIVFLYKGDICQSCFQVKDYFRAAVKRRLKVRCDASLEIINLNKNTSTKFGNVCKSRIEKGSLVSDKLQRQFQHWSWLNQWDIRRRCAFHKLVATFGSVSPDSCTLVYDYTAKAYAGPEIGF